MDEPPSPLLKSRIPRKTVIVDSPLLNDDWESRIYDVHCPLRKGIICYHRNHTIFEHNIHSSGKHEPRIIVPKHPSWHLKKISFVPIKSNRILLFAKKYTAGGPLSSADYYLHLSIHEIRSDHRVGPALWSFNGNVDGYLNNFNLELIKSTKNALGIAFWARFDDHWKLFDLSITETDASNNFPLIESGRINFDLKFKSESLRNQSPVILSPDTRILLNVDMSLRDNETIDIHYLDSDGTNFSPVTRLSIPIPEPPLIIPPELAFSADGSKFVMAMGYGGVSVWDIQSKGPLRTFTESPLPKILHRPPRYPQFSRVNLGKEILIFVERDYSDSNLAIIHLINAMSFETEERLFLKSGNHLVGGLFFDPSESTLYAELMGTLYEWGVRKKEPGPEWWIAEE